MNTKRGLSSRLAVLACLMFLMCGQALAVCYPAYQQCGEDFLYWLALNYPEIYQNPTGDHGNVVFCDAQLKDAIGRPAVGVRVQLYVSGSYSQTDGYSGYTDAEGRVRLQISKPADWGMDYARCRAFDENNVGLEAFDSDNEIGPNGRLISPSVLQIGHSADDWSDISIAEVDHYAEFPGLQPGNGRMQLYQSGIYDKAMIFVPPFDSAEGTSEKRTIDKLILALQPALIALQMQGVDTWMFMPNHTYDDLHEQSAELAQAIDYAVNYANGTGNQKVTVVGVSTGGLVSKITTARWEDPNEGAWRAAWAAAINRPDVPDNRVPVSLLGMIESPLRGANVNVDLQKLAWENDFATDRHLDSCAAMQMLTTSCLGRFNGFSFDYQCDSSRAQDFYMGDGGPIVWNFAPDFGGSNVTLCQGGPGVSDINGDGYPHEPTVIAASNGQIGQRNRCYGTGSNPSDLDRNIDYQNICPYAVSTGSTQVGWEYLKINVDDWPDRHVYFKNWDVVPGSRWDTIVDNQGSAAWGLVDWTIEQRGAPTFVALTSSLDVPGCDPFTTGDPYNNAACMPGGYDVNQGGLLDRHPSIDDSRTNSTMSTHGRIAGSIITWLVGHVVVAVNTDYVAPDPEPDPIRPGVDGSCEERCGDFEPSGTCYCDDYCEQNNDCCDDYAVYNPAPGEFQGCRPAPVCGDGICDSFSGWETEGSCCWDCGICGDPDPVCGDGICEDGEQCTSDCPPPTSTCVKGICVNQTP